MLETNIKINPDKLDTIFQSLEIVDYTSPIEGIIRLGVRGKTKGLCKKVMFRRSASKVNAVKNFRNQVSIYVRIIDFIKIKLNQSKYDISNGFFPKILKDIELDSKYVYEFKKGQTAFQFKQIKIEFEKNKINIGKKIRLFTSVLRKSQEKQLVFIDYDLEEDDIEKGYKFFEFPKGCYAHTLYIEKRELDIQVYINFMVEINMFLFTSGKIKIAGCTRIDQIDTSISVLITYLEKNLCENKLLELFGVIKDDFTIFNKKEVMINSDFTSSYPIKRFELNELIHNKFNLLSSFEPCTHPAVIIKYYHNLAYSEINGKCRCQSLYDVRHCNGRGNGNGVGQCKSVTILVFQSGKIILTGGRNMKQVESGYEFIKDILNNHELLLKSMV